MTGKYFDWIDSKTEILFYLCFLQLLFQQPSLIEAGATINDSNTLIDDLFSDYNAFTRPAFNQEMAVNISIGLMVKTIQSFDEVLGKFTFTGALITKWKDPSLGWDPSRYGGIEQVVVPYNSVWFPELMLSSAATSRVTVTQAWNKAKINYTGDIVTVSADLVDNKCDVNVKDFPFDTQICAVSFFSLSYVEKELCLMSDAQTVDFSLLTPNVLWDVIGSDVSRRIIESQEVEISFNIKLKRKPANVVAVVLMPILLLGILNGFVFLLPAESGERIGYCITTLLAIAVYMTITADMLPPSSDPVPVICYKLMVDLILSTLIVLITILNSRLYHKPDDVPIPPWLVSFYQCCSFKGCRSKVKTGPCKTKFNTSKISALSNGALIGMSQDDDIVKTKRATVSRASSYDDELNWKDISRLVDWVAFFGINCICAMSFVIFILVSLTGSS